MARAASLWGRVWAECDLEVETTVHASAAVLLNAQHQFWGLSQTAWHGCSGIPDPWLQFMAPAAALQ